MTANPTSAHLPRFSRQKVTDKLNETTGPLDNTKTRCAETSVPQEDCLGGLEKQGVSFPRKVQMPREVTHLQVTSLIPTESICSPDTGAGLGDARPRAVPGELLYQCPPFHRCAKNF